MIVVLVGTSPYSFRRLVKAADEYAGRTSEEMFIQLGNTEYIPKNGQYKRFLFREELFRKLEMADLAIAQGGFGSIADCLKAGKKLVAVPRKPELREALHSQEELVRELEKAGRLIGVYKIADLPQAIDSARNTVFKNGQKHRINSLIRDFIEMHS